MKLKLINNFLYSKLIIFSKTKGSDSTNATRLGNHALKMSQSNYIYVFIQIFYLQVLLPVPCVNLIQITRNLAKYVHFFRKKNKVFLKVLVK